MKEKEIHGVANEPEPLVAPEPRSIGHGCPGVPAHSNPALRAQDSMYGPSEDAPRLPV